MLHVSAENRILSAIYLESSLSKTGCSHLLSILTDWKIKVDSKKCSDIELHNQLHDQIKNQREQHKEYSDISRKRFGYSFPYPSIVAADPEFTIGQLKERFRLIQFDKKASAVVSIEHAMICIKEFYLRPREEGFLPPRQAMKNICSRYKRLESRDDETIAKFRANINETVRSRIARLKWCDDEMIAKFRADHVMAMGVDHPFNRTQGLKPPANRIAHQIVPVKLNGPGETVINNIKKLNRKHQAILMRVFSVRESEVQEEVAAHSPRIDAAILLIKDELVEERRGLIAENKKRGSPGSNKQGESKPLLEAHNQQQLERREQELERREMAFNAIVLTISDGRTSVDTIVDHISIRLEGGYPQLRVIGRELSEPLTRQSHSEDVSAARQAVIHHIKKLNGKHQMILMKAFSISKSGVQEDDDAYLRRIHAAILSIKNDLIPVGQVLVETVKQQKLEKSKMAFNAILLAISGGDANFDTVVHFIRIGLKGKYSQLRAIGRELSEILPQQSHSESFSPRVFAPPNAWGKYFQMRDLSRRPIHSNSPYGSINFN